MTGVRLSEKVLTGVLLILIFGSSLLSPKAWAQLAACGSPAVQPCIQKYVDPLPIPSAFVTKPITVNGGPADYYEIAARQLLQPVLSCSTDVLSPNCTSRLPKTTVWGYGQNNIVSGVAGPYDRNAPTSVCTLGTVSPPGTTTFQNCFSTPASTILANTGRLVEVKWINDVLCHTGDANCTPGTFLTYTPGVKPTFDNHWANPQQLCNNGVTATDCKGTGAYAGPVPLVVHAHGETSASESDGIPEAWNLPASGFSTATYKPYGSDYCQVDPNIFNTTSAPQRDPRCNAGNPSLPSYRGDGAARFTYPNRQFATTLFFHDHALGVTTENVYMGLAGFYLLTGTNTNVSGVTSFNFSHDLPSDCGSLTKCADGSTSVTGGLPQGDCTLAGFGVDPVTGATAIDPQTQASGCFELGLAITDKAFNTDGSLKFSESGNVILVNGRTWPFLNVEPRKYRFRIVVAAPTSRFDLMFPSTNDNATGPTVTLTQIGADGGLLPHPSRPLTKLSLMPGERADVIVDFSNFWFCAQPFGSGCSVKLLNGNGSRATAELMQFNIVPFAGCDPTNIITCFPPTADTSCNPSVVDCTNTQTTFPHRSSEPVTAPTRQVSLFDDHLGNCPIAGCVSSNPLPWDGTVTENPTVGKTEIWEMYDFQDSHPMHLHEAQFEVVNRENMSTHVVYNCVGSAKNANGQTVNCASPPVPGETGFKDTVQANGGTITRLRATFAGPVGPASDPAPEMNPGLFAWHCHINPHEDNEMMRPMCVLRQGQSATNVSAENFCQ